MLKNIPFYSSLLGRQIGKTTTKHSHVLVYGAIEAHSMGEKGCIASNKTIALETGLGEGTVANRISELNQFGWIKVTLNDYNHRTSIVPLLELRVPSLPSEPPFTPELTPLHSPVNIEYSNKNTVIDNSSNEELAKANSESFSLIRKKASKGSRVSKNLSECKNPVEKNTPPQIPPTPPQISVKLGYEFCTKHKLPILNNATFKTKMKQLAGLMDNDDTKVTRYFEALEKLQAKECLDDPYCPKVYNCLDIYGKYNNVKTYYTRKLDEKKAKMSPVAELMAKQNGTYDTGGIL